jgi:hypothetical protein
MTTPDQQSPGPSAFFLKSEETLENTERDANTPEPAGKGDIQMKYSSDNISSKIITCKNLGQRRYCWIIQNILYSGRFSVMRRLD